MSAMSLAKRKGDSGGDAGHTRGPRGDNMSNEKTPCPTFDEAIDPQWRGGESYGYPLNPAGRATRTPQDESEG